MKKRLLSLLLVLAVVFSFSLSAFATDTGIDIIDDPLSYYFENQMLGVQKGTGVTLVCPKCDYKVVYTGGTLVTCPHDGEALVLSDLAGVHAEKFTPGGGSTSGGGIGRKDLPGFEDEKGTAQVSKEGKLTYVVHPRLLLNSGSLSVPYQNFYSDNEYHTDNCKRTGNHETSGCWHNQFLLIIICIIMITSVLMLCGISAHTQPCDYFGKFKTLSPVLIMSLRVSPYFAIENH